MIKYIYVIKIRKGIKEMTKEQKLAIMKNRLSVLEGTPKNIKSGGCVRKLKRQIRRMEQ